MGDVASKLDDLDSPLDLAEGIVNRLPVLGCQCFSHLLATSRHDLAEGEHDILTLGKGRVPPGLKRLLRGADRLIDVPAVRQSDLPGLNARGRIENRADPG